MKKFTNHLITFLATGGYVGRIPWAPGTWGTLVGVALYFGLVQLLAPVALMGVSLLFIFFSIFVCHLYESISGQHDPKQIVIDEIAGFLVAMMWIPPTWINFVIAFVLFRFFDIVKPPPIRRIDQQIEGGLGVVADDVAAGIATNILLQLMVRYL